MKKIWYVTTRVTQDYHIEVEADTEEEARALAKATRLDDWTDDGGDREIEVEEVE